MNNMNLTLTINRVREDNWKQNIIKYNITGSCIESYIDELSQD